MAINAYLDLQKIERHASVYRMDALNIRSINVMSRTRANEALASSGGDASAARASLLGHRDAAPHERGLSSDRHITGGVGGQDRNGPSRELWGGANASLGHKQYSQPMTRGIRPTNAKGQTSFYMEFTCINQANLTCGLPVKGGIAVRPDTHVSYIEAIEKRDDAAVDRPIKGDGYAQYQERELATDSDEVESVLSNIAGSQVNRVRLFKKAEAFEPTLRLPKLTVCVRDGNPLPISACRFMLETGAVPTTCKFHEPEGDSGQFIMAIEGEPAVTAYNMLKKNLDWHEGEACAEHGISWDPGKSGRVQMRIVGELPKEVDQAARARICAHVIAPFEERRIPYVLAMHKPTPGNHKDNWHFHLIYYDRPTEPFDPMGLKAQLQAGVLPVERYNKRYAGHIAAALSDPAVCKQAGKFDFEVQYTYQDDRGRKRTIRPFVQNKDRSLTRCNFVKEQRDRMAQITNLELERAGANRRVSAERYADFGIIKKNGIHLGFNKTKLELAGFPTAEGMLNEQHQSDYISQAIQDRYQQAINVAETDMSQPKWGLARDGQPAGYKLLDDYVAHQRSEIDANHAFEKANALNKQLFSRTTSIVKHRLSFLQANNVESDDPKRAEANRRHLEVLTEAREHAAAIAKLFAAELRIASQARRIAREESRKAAAILEAFESNLRGEGVSVELRRQAQDHEETPIPVTIAVGEALPAAGPVVTPVSDTHAVAAVPPREVDPVAIEQTISDRIAKLTQVQASETPTPFEVSKSPALKPVDAITDIKEKARARKFRSALDHWAEGYLDAKVEVLAEGQFLIVTGDDQWAACYPNPLLAKTNHEIARLRGVSQIAAKRVATKQAAKTAKEASISVERASVACATEAKIPVNPAAVTNSAQLKPTNAPMSSVAMQRSATTISENSSANAVQICAAPKSVPSASKVELAMKAKQQAEGREAELTRQKQVAQIFDLWPAGYLEVDVDRRGDQIWLNVCKTKGHWQTFLPRLEVVSPEERSRFNEAMRAIAWQRRQAERNNHLASQQMAAGDDTNQRIEVSAAKPDRQASADREMPHAVHDASEKKQTSVAGQRAAGETLSEALITIPQTTHAAVDSGSITQPVERLASSIPAQTQPSQFKAETVIRVAPPAVANETGPMAVRPQKDREKPMMSGSSVALIPASCGVPARSVLKRSASDTSHEPVQRAPGIPAELSAILKYIEQHDLEVLGDQKSGLTVSLPAEMSGNAAVLKTRLAQVSLNASHAKQAKICNRMRLKIAACVISTEQIFTDTATLRASMPPADHTDFDRVSRWSVFPAMFSDALRQREKEMREQTMKGTGAVPVSGKQVRGQPFLDTIENGRRSDRALNADAEPILPRESNGPPEPSKAAIHAAIHQKQLGW